MTQPFSVKLTDHNLLILSNSSFISMFEANFFIYIPFQMNQKYFDWWKTVLIIFQQFSHVFYLHTLNILLPKTYQKLCLNTKGILALIFTELDVPTSFWYPNQFVQNFYNSLQKHIINFPKKKHQQQQNVLISNLPRITFHNPKKIKKKNNSILM